MLLSLRVEGQTGFILISVNSCIGIFRGELQHSVINYDTDSPFSNKLSMRSRLLVLLWMSRLRYNG